jgi:hypothetical protein
MKWSHCYHKWMLYIRISLMLAQVGDFVCLCGIHLLYFESHLVIVLLPYFRASIIINKSEFNRSAWWVDSDCQDSARNDWVYVIYREGRFAGIWTSWKDFEGRHGRVGGHKDDAEERNQQGSSHSHLYLLLLRSCHSYHFHINKWSYSHWLFW